MKALTEHHMALIREALGGKAYTISFAAIGQGEILIIAPDHLNPIDWIRVGQIIGSNRDVEVTEGDQRVFDGVFGGGKVRIYLTARGEKDGR